MDIKASIDKEAFGYRNRLLVIALGALFYAALCVYDAKVKYPDQIEARQTLEELKVEHPSDWKDRWPEIATANDWDPTKEPKERSQGDINTQWWQFAVVFPIGMYCLISVIVWSRRSIGIDENKFYAYGGVEVPFEAITRIDASRWQRKGIAKVYYTAGDVEKSVIIDDFKFERQPTNEIFDRLKNEVGEDKIEGLVETGIDAEAAEALDAAKDEQPQA